MVNLVVFELLGEARVLGVKYNFYASVFLFWPYILEWYDFTVKLEEVDTLS